MHSFNVRDDISVCTDGSTASRRTGAFRRSWSLSRRDSKSTIHFRDDLSEYSNTSSWSESAGPLNFRDYRIVSEGLQEKRTLAEAVLRAEWERQRDEETKMATRTREGCSTCVGEACLGPKLNRIRLRLLGRAPPPKPAVVFSWSEVRSLVLLPCGEAGPYLMVITTFRLPEEREWLLQAPSLRARARWGIEMVASILRSKCASVSQDGNMKCCCSSSVQPLVSTAFFMDSARVACEAAKCQPSIEGMELLAEVLDLLAESQHRGQCGDVSPTLAPAPHIPIAALRRFGDAVRRASADLMEWQQWHLTAQLIMPKHSLEADVWCKHLLPFLSPREPSLRDVGAGKENYPQTVDHQLGVAAERCRRTLL